MNESKSTMTSKGQITLPKTIRDVMNLSTGDQVTFTVQPNNQVVMEKAEVSIKSQAKMNLVSLLLQNDLPVIIKGKAGMGKTYFVKTFLMNQFSDKKVAVIEPFGEGYNQLDDYMVDFTSIFSDNLEAVIPNIIENKYELVVIEEFAYYNLDSIKVLSHNKQKLILISQEFELTDLLELGSHFTISLNIGGIVIEHYELFNDTFKIKSIYID